MERALVQRTFLAGGLAHRPVDWNCRSRARKYLVYATFAGMWYLAPGSKSCSVRATGADTPWYLVRSAHQALLYSEGAVFPLNTSQRHWSISLPKGRNATLASAFFIWKLITAFSSLWIAGTRPSCFRYPGVIERTSASPMASWKPSFAPA